MISHPDSFEKRGAGESVKVTALFTLQVNAVLPQKDLRKKWKAIFIPRNPAERLKGFV